MLRSGVQKQGERITSKVFYLAGHDEPSEGRFSRHGAVQLNGQALPLQHLHHGARTRFQSNDLIAIVDQDVEFLKKVLAEQSTHLRGKATILTQAKEKEVFACNSGSGDGKRVCVNSRRGH